jgi:5-methyltetrahydropteroyltriglutamate--homocysteine methyltransferase
LAVLISLSGQHPRSEKVVQATQDYERGRIDEKSLNEAFIEDVSSLISLQEKLNSDFITDGQMTEDWNDLFRPFTENVKGIKKGPLVRWFNTNTFYYVPVIYQEPETDGKIIMNKVNKAIFKTGKGKIIIPDPFTFVECSENRTKMDDEQLMFSYSENVINPELKELEKMGLRYVQFSSPSLVARFRQPHVSRERLILLGEAIRVALKGTSLRSGFYSYFGDASKYIPFLYDVIPTEDIGFDMTETDFRNIQPSEKCLIAGVVNSRSSYVEKKEEIALIVQKLKDKFEEIILCPSSDLQYIPRDYADKKMKILSDVRKIVDE